MKSVADYPVTFAFGAVTAPYTMRHPHLGEDRKCPVGTPDKVNGQVVGLSGNSGRSTGAHHHMQRTKDGKVIHPRGGGFDLPSPVVVTETGQKDDIGKYIRVRDGNGEVWSRFHLSEIRVKVGDKIGANMTKEQAQAVSKWVRLLQHMSEKDAASYSKVDVPYLMEKPENLGKFLEGAYKSKEWQDANYKAVNYKKDVEAAKAQAAQGMPKLKKIEVYIPEGQSM